MVPQRKGRGPPPVGVGRRARQSVVQTRLHAPRREPLSEPIVQHGPFVMSTQDQIMQAGRTTTRATSSRRARIGSTKGKTANKEAMGATWTAARLRLHLVARLLELLVELCLAKGGPIA